MSQMNRNAAYVYEVDGLTVWERLRVVRGFLLDRQTELELAILRHEDSKAKMLLLPEDNIDRKEFFIREPHSLCIIDDCKREVDFLVKYEKQLREEAEPLRIEGKSDKDMYELNFLEEKIQRLVLSTQSELMTIGIVTSQTMTELLRCRPALNRVSKIGLLKDVRVAELLEYKPAQETFAITLLSEGEQLRSSDDGTMYLKHISE